MLSLYYKPTCPFSKKVLAAAEELGIELDLKNIKESQELVEELIALGGKKQTPFLLDTEHELKMYESNDIIDHLTEHHARDMDTNRIEAIRVHKSSVDTCNVCE